MEKEFNQNIEMENVSAEAEILQPETLEINEPETAIEEIAPVAEVEIPALEVKKAVPVKAVEAPAKAKANKRVLVGKVTSNKADKTIVIAVVRQVSHPLYKKYFKRTNSFMAHDESNECKIGDKVKVKECRPMSARKRWELVEILERAK